MHDKNAMFGLKMMVERDMMEESLAYENDKAT